MAFDDEDQVDNALQEQQPARLSNSRPMPTAGPVSGGASGLTSQTRQPARASSNPGPAAAAGPVSNGQRNRTSYGLNLPSFPVGRSTARSGSGAKQPEWMSGPSPSYSPATPTTPSRRPRPTAGAGFEAPSPSGAQQAGLATRAITGAGSTPLPTSPMSAINAISGAVRFAARPLMESLTQSAHEFGAGVAGSTTANGTPRATSPPGTPAALPAMEAGSSPVSAMSPIGSAAAATAPAGMPTAAAGPRVNIINPNDPGSMSTRPPAPPIAVKPKPYDIGANGEHAYTNETLARAGRLSGSAPASSPMVATRPAPIQAAPSSAPQVQETTDRAVGAVRGATRSAQNDAGAMVTDAFSPSAEMMRRLRISESSSFNAGSPAKRARAAAAIMGQLGALNDASEAGQGATNDVLQGSAADENIANERGAERRQAAGVTTAGNDLLQQQMQSDERVARRPRIMTAAGGRLGLVGDDASFTPVTDSGGIQVRPLAEQSGLSADARLKFIGDQVGMLMGSEGYGYPGPDGNPDPRVAQVQSLQQQADAMLRSGSAQGGEPGGEAVGDSPYPEGTQLTGRDGKRFVVQNGMPMPVEG